jgi:hypothetical protein
MELLLFAVLFGLLAWGAVKIVLECRPGIATFPGGMYKVLECR